MHTIQSKVAAMLASMIYFKSMPYNQCYMVHHLALTDLSRSTNEQTARKHDIDDGAYACAMYSM
jgi:hypothetical protein